MKQNPYSQLNRKKILVTCGPTWVPIDDTRVISNISSGTLGQIIADQFSAQGARVTLLEGPVQNPRASGKITIKKFQYYEDYLKLIRAELKEPYTIVIHAAAVSDYRLKKQFAQKLSSSHKVLNLRLVKTMKVINLVKKINPKVTLVGFKLASTMTRAIAKKKTNDLFIKAHCDYVVANSVRQNKYKGFIVDRSGALLAESNTRLGMARYLVRILNLS